MSINIPKLGDALTYSYNYDQLNRLVAMDAYNGFNNSTNTFTPINISDYKERLTYDPNGKIMSYARWGKNRQLDNATYNYYSNTNRLEHIGDPVGKITDDPSNQAASNYQWDAIGEMTKDVDRGLNTATWTVYGKIQTQTLINGTTINYTYDASNNRISKTVSGTGGYTEWYVRDASGNTMAIYRNDVTINSGALTQTEVHLYGSNRLGILNTNVNCTNLVMSSLRVFTRGNKLFELTEHRGNVMLAISDKRLQHTTDNTTVDYYNADVISAQDYSSFGALLDGRQFGNTTRFTYNGKQLDKELGWQDYGMREYLGGSVTIFAGVDPITKNYPELTPYQFASNTPIQAIDLDGLEAFFVHGTWSDSKTWSALKNENYASINDATGNKTDFTFDWKYNNIKGANLDAARQKAGKQLADRIIQIHKLHPDEPITIVGHSHGGNVGIIATNILEKRGYKVNYLVTINTPVSRYQLSSQAQTNTKHFNIYDSYDPVQSHGGNTVTILPFLNGRKGTGEFGAADRTFDNAKNLDVYRKDAWYNPRGLTQFFNFGDDVHNSHNKPQLWNGWLYNRIQGGKWYSNYQQQQGQIYQQRSQDPSYNSTDNTRVSTTSPAFPNQRKE